MKKVPKKNARDYINTTLTKLIYSNKLLGLTRTTDDADSVQNACNVTILTSVEIEDGRTGGLS